MSHDAEMKSGLEISESQNKPRSVRIWGVVRRTFMRLLNGFEDVVQMIMLFVLLVVASTVISEIAGRQALLTMAADRVDGARQAVVRSSGGADVVQTVTSAPETVDQSLASAASSARMDLAAAESLQRGIRALIAVGAVGEEQSMNVLRVRFSDLTAKRSSQVRRAGSVTMALKLLGFDLELAPSDHLVAVALICCGTIGSLIAAIRHNRRAKLHMITMGAAAGFVSVLVIKGGRYIFLMQLNPDAVSLNPYSCALAALIAGLFTHRAYHLLSDAVGNLAKKLDAAITDK
jgi:hypothetical protein